VAKTPALILVACAKPPVSLSLDGQPLMSTKYSEDGHLLWVQFPNEASPRTMEIKF
jgi:hypothetical protein